jgi:ATP-dependent RNA helicase RhlE
VFVKTRKGVDALVKILLEQGVAADAIHGDKTQPARLRALDRFKTAQVQVLVATDVAARGLDIDALPQVVNFDLPTVAEDYIHRIGRTGRAGAEGEAVSLVCADEVDLLAEIEKLTRQVIRREEEPGFEADHRVPATGPAGAAAAVAAAAAKEATSKKKRAFTGPPGGKAALAGGHPGKSSAAPVPRMGAQPAKPAAAKPVPKGAVFVSAGRGAKSTARAAAQPAARQTGNSGKPGRRGPAR